jgi:hypothetical protein
MRGSICGVIGLVAVAGWALQLVGQVAATGTTTIEKPKATQVARLPYTAEYKITNVKTLADGSTITRESTEVDALDSQGRRMNAKGGETPVSSYQRSITNFWVSDRVAQVNISWNSVVHSASVTAMQGKPVAGHVSAAASPCAGSAPASMSSTISVQPAKPKPAIEDPATKAHEEIAAVKARMRAEKQEKPPTIELVMSEKPVQIQEDLGLATILGLEARGQRTTTTTPAGAIGNSAPLVETYERWFATTPGMTGLLVREVRNSPVNGRRTEILVKFTQSEPDPMLFKPPVGYEIENFPQVVPESRCPQSAPPAPEDTFRLH